MNTKSKLAVGALAVPFLLGAGALTASAYQGDPTIQGPNCDDEHHEAMEEAFENLDYEAWAALMDGRGRAASVVTEENFEQFAEAHELAEAGDFEAAAEIRAELGLGVGTGRRGGNGGQMGRGMGAGQHWSQ